MTTPKKHGAKRKATKRTARVKRTAPARSGPIRTGAHLPKDEPAPHSGGAAGMSPQARANVDHDEGLINQSVADAVRNANQVLSDTVAQGRVAAEQFRHGGYNMRDVPVDVQILGNRMIKLARELSDTTLNILEQLLKQMTQVPASPPSGLKGSVPPFPTGNRQDGEAPPSTTNGAPPSSHPSEPAPQDRMLKLTVRFEGRSKAKALPSPLWKPTKATLPSELAITPMMHILEEDDPITDVDFDADLDGNLIVTVTIPPKQAPGVYAGMVLADYSDAPLGVLTIEIMK